MKHFITSIINGLDDAAFIWRREMRTILTDQGILMFVFFLCLFYPLIYSYIYNNEVVREVPVVVIDRDQSSMSREFIRKVDATADVAVIRQADDMEQAKELMRKREVFGIIYIPSDFRSQVSRGEKSTISLFCDMSGMLNYSAIYGACSSVSLDMNKDIKILKLGNTTDRQDEISTQPIAYQEISIFNPQKGVATYLLPAVLILILQQSLLLGITLSAGTDRENNRFRDLVPIHKKYQGTLRIILGKTTAYLTIYMLLSAYVLIIVPHIFRLVQIGSFTTVAAFILPFLLASIFFAFTLSIFVRSREACILLFVFSSVPLLFISGISWPGAAIPGFWKVVSWFFPSTFGINGFVRINNMGASLEQVLPEFRALWLQTGIYFATAFLVYRYQIILSRKHYIQRMNELKEKAKEKEAKA